MKKEIKFKFSTFLDINVIFSSKNELSQVYY